MLLHFPSAAVLMQALECGAIPSALLRDPVHAASLPSGLYIHAPDVRPRAGSTLATLGVTRVATLPDGELGEYPMWASLLPLQGTRDLHVPPTALIRCSTAAHFSHLVATIHRLKGMGLQFAHHGTGANLCHWLRVPYPPTLVLHTCWQATATPLFIEQAPRIWVALGWTHPRPDLIRVPTGKFLVIDADGVWHIRTEPHWLPIDARKAVELAPCDRWPTHVAWPPTIVPTRLLPSRETSAAELWVLHDDFTALQHFVDTADERLLDELDFAVTHDDAPTRVLLRSRQRRLGPPTLPHLGQAYASLLKLPNVYLPGGRRLDPPLRRDVVRTWLCQPDRVTWLTPENTTIRIESIPTDAFRPLREWVEYAVPQRRIRTTERRQSRLFVMEPFTSPEERKPKTASLKVDATEDATAPQTITPVLNVVQGKAPERPRTLPPIAELDELAIPMSEALQQLQTLEEQFLAMTGPVDAPERLALWPALAMTATLAGQEDDAGVCWGNALWEREFPEGVRRWFRDEQRLVTNIPKLLTHGEPLLHELRTVAAWLCAGIVAPATAEQVRPHLSRIAMFLERFEHRLPVRLAWLAWQALATLSGGDILALTRARDRMLANLLEHGLRRDRDMPSFLRSGGVRSSIQQHVDIDRFLRLADHAKSWCSGRSLGHTHHGDPVEKHFVELIFAFALAKFGDTEGAKLLLADVGLPNDWASHQPLPYPISAGQQWLWRTYRERVVNLLAGQAANTPLNLERRRELSALPAKDRALADQFLQFSRILEPFDRVDPFRQSRIHGSPLEARLAELTAANIGRKKRDRTMEQHEMGFRELLQSYKQPEQRERILHAAVPISVRFGENFALECLEQVAPAVLRQMHLVDVQDLIRRVELLESALSVSAHFGRNALLTQFVDLLQHQLRMLDQEKAAWLISAFGAGGLRFLCRMGLANVANELLKTMTHALTGKQSLKDFLAKKSLNRGIVYPALLRLSGGWFYFENDEPAQLTLNVVREELLTGSASHAPRALLASAYALALGHAPVKQALAAFFDLFERLPAPTITDMQNMPIFTVQRLRVVESVALAMASEDFAVDGRTRRWLDEDEYTVRRRIHRDVEQALKGVNLS